jgi:hypothetical protein
VIFVLPENVDVLGAPLVGVTVAVMNPPAATDEGASIW